MFYGLQKISFYSNRKIRIKGYNKISKIRDKISKNEDFGVFSPVLASLHPHTAHD